MASPPQRTPRLAPEVRRAQLLDAALDVLTERGFDAITVEAVAQRAGVTRPVVYDMFGDLDGLMLALIDREESSALTPLLQIVGGPPADDVDPEAFLIDAILAFLRAVKSNPRTWRLVLMPPRGSSRELGERIRRSRRLVADRITSLLDWGIALRGGPAGLDHQLAARLIVAAGEDAARLMLAHPRRYPPERLASVARELLALAPPDSEPRGRPVPELPAPVGPSPVQPSRVEPSPGAASPGAPNDPIVPSPVVPAPAAAPAGSRARIPRARRREQLLDVALELLASEGFSALSMEAVARRAGVNRVVVYRSFANLQLLLIALLRREDRRTQTALEALLPTDPRGLDPAQLLGDALARFLAEVASQPLTWRAALLRPESAPLALQKLVNRRRAEVARRLEPLVRWGLTTVPGAPDTPDVEVLSRMLLSIAEEQGRLALEDPKFPPQRLMASTWMLLDSLPAAR